MIHNQSVFLSSTINHKIRNNPDFTTFQYGVFLVTGYNTWNFYVYYGLNPIFNKNALLNNRLIDMNVMNLGLQFYIL